MWLPRDHIILTTCHVRHVEMLTDVGNKHLEEVLRREAESDPEELARKHQGQRTSAASQVTEAAHDEQIYAGLTLSKRTTRKSVRKAEADMDSLLL